MRNRLKLTISVTLAALFFACSPVDVAAITSSVNFNTITDLTDNFNSDGSPQFTNQATGGIGNTGSVNVPVPSNDIWTTKQGYSVSGAADSVYTFSAYFKVAQNGGYGNLGFTNASSSTPDGIGQPALGLGANFHGGGGAFVNNGIQTTLSWPPDLVLGNWYWMVFEVTTNGSNSFDLKLQIWNTDATGTIGTMKTEKTQNNVVNNQLGTASTIHGFFSAAGSRMDRIDNFQIDLEGAIFVEEGTPVVISDATVEDITATTADFGADVIDDKGSAVTARGVCWATTTGPTTADSCTTNGTGTGAFAATLTGLSASTTYYVIAYATNGVGTSYGAEVSFMTDAGPVTDTDGIDNTVESNGPNAGDANDDGTADNLQANVGSMPNPITGEYVVLEVGCTNVNSIVMELESDLTEDSGYTYPEGMMNFTISGCSVGATVTVSQYYYGMAETENLVARKYDTNTPGYRNLVGAAVETIEIAAQQVVKLTYTIQDGGELDMDGTANGTIVDPAGLGLATAGIPDTGFAPRPDSAKHAALAILAATTFLAGLYYYEAICRPTKIKILF